MTTQPGTSNNAPRKQHTVSRGILRKFTDPKTRLLETYDLVFDKPYPRSTGQVGFVIDYVKHLPVETEARWQSVENDLPRFYKSLEDKTLLDSDETIDLAKRVIALHVVRSLTRKLLQEEVIERARVGVIRDLAFKQKELEIAFHRGTGGLYSAGPEALEIQAERTAAIAVAALADDQFWQSRLMANINELEDWLAPRSIQVLEITDGASEFLIADDPAPTLAYGYTGLGPLSGVSYDKTNSISLPVTPHFAIALIDKPEWRTATPDVVYFLNCVELSYAKRRVFYNPNSPLRELAHRAVAARNVRPESLGPTLISLDPL